MMLGKDKIRELKDLESYIIPQDQSYIMAIGCSILSEKDILSLISVWRLYIGEEDNITVPKN